jgi:inner membrane protein
MLRFYVSEEGSITCRNSRTFRAGRTGIVTGVTAALYAFLFVVLCLHDYPLLVGSIGLLVSLAGVMYATRNVDWYTQAGRSMDATGGPTVNGEQT